MHEARSCCAAVTTIVSTTSLSSPAETLYPFNSSSPVPFPGPPYHHPASVSGNLTALRATQKMSFCDRLLSLSVMSSGFVHAAACVRICFLFRAEPRWGFEMGASTRKVWGSPCSCRPGAVRPAPPPGLVLPCSPLGVRACSAARCSGLRAPCAGCGFFVRDCQRDPHPDMHTPTAFPA